MLLDGKVAIVSGIGPGMGRDISLAFAREGAHVVLGGRTQSRLEEVAKEVEAAGVKALPVVCDITDEASCQALAAQAAAELGGIDIVVNNAYDGGDAKTLMDADLARWHQTMEVNLFGALYLTRAAVPHLEASGDGRVIMINSMSTQRIQPKFGAYNASKSALAGITKTLALELGPKGIRVNAVHPGYIYGDS
ncbi:MAG TPA: SDR family NAD(P)-dependent oxidoreductase, partial [Acidimicrobiales bacterium]